MTEAERIAYVKEFVKVEELKMGPDKKPDSEEPVPGLLRIEGEVVNAGSRSVDRVIFAFYPKGQDGEVLSAHFEDVVRKGGGLKPGQRRSFRFTIPDKKAIDKAFGHELR